MEYGFEEFHGELTSVAADLLAKERTVAWPVLAEAGWTGLEISEDLGGAGATFTETAIICEEIGRSASANSYLGGAVLTVGALNAVQRSTSRDELLAGTASGALRSAVVTEGMTLNGNRLHGQAQFVPDADGADRILVAATEPTGIPVIVDATGLDLTLQPVLDETRRLAAVTADAVEVDEAAVWRFDGDADAALRRIRDRAAVAVACDSLGIIGAMLAATVSYTGVRHQFGRPIGSFQAVKHACADMHVALTISRQLVSTAVAAVATDRPDASVAAAMAKAHACDAAVDVVGKAMQLHGGIGYTWESDVHVYLKRAALNRALFGSPSAHRKKLAQRYVQESGD